MTLKTSWFNFGIYKNALRRFKWGSFLYFVILFFAVPFMFFVGNYSYGYYRNYNEGNILPQMILEQDFLIVPILTAYTVSVVVGVILHRYMHESKQSIAMHSMPVTRKSNYISNLLAGFTLMFAPVVANGIILLIMSFTDYGKLFSPIAVLYWMIFNIAVLFIMFSVSTFAAFLTGQWAAHVAITGLLHLLPIFAALGIAFFSDVFLYGFVDSSSSAATILMDNTPFVWICNRGINQPLVRGFFSTTNVVVYLVMTVVLYALAYIIYNIRKVEVCGDVAAFKIVRYVLKYGITALIMLAVSAIGYEAELSLLTIIILNLVFGAIGYFATEMVLSKSLKVFGKYKGFLAFCVAAAAFVCFFAFTDVFGFETRVPDAEKVKSASMHGYTEAVPYVEDEDFIRHINHIHKELVENVPVVNPAHYSIAPWHTIDVSYILENGKELERRYYVTENEYNAIMTSMYKNETYKLKAENMYYLNKDALNGVSFRARLQRAGHIYTFYFNREQAIQLIDAYEKDIKTLSYAEIKAVNKAGIYFDIEICTRDEESDEIIENLITAEGRKAYGYVPYNFYYYFNEEYENTVNLLKEWGHYDSIMVMVADNLYFCPIPVGIDPPMGNEDTVYSYKEDVGYLHEFQVNIDDCVKLSREDGMTYIENLKDTEKDLYGRPAGTYYAVYWKVLSGEEKIFPLDNYLELIEVNDLPDYLKKYIE